MQFFGNAREDLESAALAASMRAIKICQESASVFPFDADEHRRWCEERTREPMLVKVSEPETRGSYLKKHVTFLITEENHKYCVRRRFSDFEWLHTVLKARYIGKLIPSLPEKNVLQSEAFIQSRIRGLHLFLQHVVASPYMRGDPAVLSFLSRADEQGWEAAKKETSVMENGGQGHKRWIKRIATQNVPASAEHDIALFKRQVEQQEKIMLELVACTKRLADKSAAMAKDVGTLFSLFNGWSVSETTSPEDNADLLLAIGKTSQCFLLKYWNEPGIYELILHESLKYLAHQVKDMREMLAYREAVIQASQGVGVAASSVATMASAASNLASRFRSASEPTPAQLEQNKAQSQHASELTTKALFAGEMERFRNQKKTALEDAFNHFACAQGHLTKKTAAVWRDHIKANVSDPAALLHSTKQILHGVGSSAEASASAADAY